MNWRIVFPASLALVAVLLSGCSMPTHYIGNWEKKLDYLTTFSYITPSGTPILNTCRTHLPEAVKCNGHGHCTRFANFNVSFCVCDLEYADPECSTERKSQSLAFFLSITFGMVGADQFYLGYPFYGVLKLFSLGGLGIWYVYDLVRIGSSTVRTYNHFDVAGDLPYATYLFIMVVITVSIGLLVGNRSLSSSRLDKARGLLELKVQGRVGPRSYGSNEMML